jgi:hypothetical protein
MLHLHLLPLPADMLLLVAAASTVLQLLGCKTLLPRLVGHGQPGMVGIVLSDLHFGVA